MTARILAAGALTLIIASLNTRAFFGQTVETGPPAFSRWSTFCEGLEHTATVVLADLDGDRDLDVIFGNGRHFEEPNWVLSNDGNGIFYGRRELGLEVNPTHGLGVGDVDGDGALDVFVANDSGHSSVIYRNDGKGNFTFLESLGRGTRRAVAVGDLDGDRDADAVLVGADQDHILVNDGGGRKWTERPLGPSQPAPARTGVALADLDRDGDLDIIVPGRGRAATVVYFNDGKAGFAESRTVGRVADDSTSVAAGDVDGDGDLDLVVANWEQAHTVLVNDGRGGFSHSGSFGSGQENTWSIVLSDIDLDGDLDAAVANRNVAQWAVDVNGDGVDVRDLYGDERRDVPSRVYVNNGSGQFAPGPTFGTGSDNTRSIAAGDVDGDGDIDLVLGNDCQPNHVFFNSLRGRKPERLP